MRLNKYLAKSGIASRRKCDQFIENGKIMINGETVTNFGYRVKSDDIVTFEGKVVSEHSDVIYILNKPKGYVCSNKEEFKNKRSYWCGRFICCGLFTWACEQYVSKRMFRKRN